MLNRPEIAMVKLTQVYFTEQSRTFGEVSQLLTCSVAKSGLELFIGQLSPKAIPVKARMIKLISPDDLWYFDGLSLKAHANNTYQRR